MAVALTLYKVHPFSPPQVCSQLDHIQELAEDYDNEQEGDARMNDIPQDADAKTITINTLDDCPLVNIGGIIARKMLDLYGVYRYRQIDEQGREQKIKLVLSK